MFVKHLVAALIATSLLAAPVAFGTTAKSAAKSPKTHTVAVTTVKPAPHKAVTKSKSTAKTAVKSSKTAKTAKTAKPAEKK
jgi:hypothetical protein